MAFQKFAADHLFDGHRFRTAEEVLILDEEGRVQEIVERAEAGDGIRQMEGILSPGLINCHCHLELSHLRGLIPKGGGLVEFVGQVMRHRNTDPAVIGEAIRNGINELRSEGIVATGDICNTDHTAAIKASSGLHFQNFVEVSGFDPALADSRFAEALRVLEAFQRRGLPGSIVPHAPYSVSPQLWQKIIGLKDNQLLSIHNQEDEAETDLFRGRTGRFMDLYAAMKLDVSFFQASGLSSLQTYHRHFRSTDGEKRRVLLVHNVFTQPDDLDWMVTQSDGPALHWCLCPSANLYINNRLPPVNLFRERGLQIVLGTDSLASNDRLSILAEMRLIRDAFDGVELEELFTWATSNGAEALGIESESGSFQPGLKPGLVRVTTDLGLIERIL